jgi:hypothetical protein
MNVWPFSPYIRIFLGLILDFMIGTVVPNPLIRTPWFELAGKLRPAVGPPDTPYVPGTARVKSLAATRLGEQLLRSKVFIVLRRVPILVKT